MNSVFGLLPQMLSELLLAFGEETALLSAKFEATPNGVPVVQKFITLSGTYHFELSHAMEGKKDARGEAYFVGMREELIEAKRSIRTLGGRDVLVIYHLETFYAMDSHCYHEAGALQTGDIEELGGKLCIICPNHKYKITLAEGEGLYKYTDPKEKSPVTRWLSKGPKQRVHSVTEANGEVYVKLSEDPQWRESDFYQGERGKVQRAKVEEAKAAKAAKALQEKKS